MTVLITGVAGRIGATLAQRLLHADYAVRGMVRPGGRPVPAVLRPDIDVVEASLTDPDAVAHAVQGVDTVVHLAARMAIGDAVPDQFFDVNVGGTLRLLESAVRQPNPVRRFVLASTDNTYGPARPRTPLITEDHPQLPGDYYGTSKVLAELLARNYHQLYGLEYSILRFGSVLAPHEAPPLFRLDWVRAFLSAQAAAGKRGNLWPLFAGRGDLTAVVDGAVGPRRDNPAVVLTGRDGEPWAVHLTDVRDAASGTLLAIEHPAAANEAFNIVGPHTTTFSEAAAVLAKRLDLDTVTVELPVKLAFELSTAKAHGALGYRPHWDFEGMVAAALDGNRDDYVRAGAE